MGSHCQYQRQTKPGNARNTKERRPTNANTLLISLHVNQSHKRDVKTHGMTFLDDTRITKHTKIKSLI